MLVLFAISLSRALEPDLDGDGWGANVDCDDLDAAVNPHAAEVCDEIDNDCDGLVDDDDVWVWTGYWFYEDLDGDGVGGEGKRYCVRPPDSVRVDGDCDDTDASINPAAVEVCDDVDNDCDGLIDVDDPALVGVVYYEDSDHDGYGDDTITVTQCTAPDGYVEVGGDCDVADASTHPDAPEICDGIDNDCDGSVDDAVVAVAWFGDADGDGYGAFSDVQRACFRPRGYTPLPGDCDDTSATVFPGADEVCGNGVDEDCNGAWDDCLVAVDDVADVVLANSSSSSGLGAPIVVGDVDDDGTADLLVAAPAWPDTTGAVIAELGPAAGLVLAESADRVVTSSYVSEGAFGSTLAFGDADGDGVGDLLVGTPAFWNGAAQLMSGPIAASADPLDPDAVLYPGTGYEYPGAAVAVIPDHDGDGTPELAVGAPGAYLRYGTIYVVPGDVTGEQAVEDAAWYRYRFPGRDKFGQSVTALDENGDGLSDVLGAAPHTAAVYLIDGGGPRGLYSVDAVADASFRGERESDQFGACLASNDLDGDGYADVLIAAPHAATEAGRSSAGVVYAFYGPFAGAVSVSDATTQWLGAGGNFGSAIATGADVDGDGQVDTLFGDPHHAWSRGTVYLQLGAAEGVIGTDLLTTFTSEDVAGFGSSLAFVPDWDGDGLSEIAAGAPGAGSAYVIFSDSLFE